MVKAKIESLSNSLVIQQLETSIGISGFFLKWIPSYLSNRSSVVFVNNSYSTFSSFPFGVLQASVFGSLLFILHTSVLPKIIPSFSL